MIDFFYLPQKKGHKTYTFMDESSSPIFLDKTDS